MADQGVLDEPIDLDLKQGTRKEYLDEIESRTDLNFSYNPETVQIDKIIQLDVRAQSIRTILTEMFDDQELDFILRGKRVLIIKKQNNPNQKSTLSGHILDIATGEVLIGATIAAKPIESSSDWFGVAANTYGFYSLTLPSGTYDLTVTYIGYDAYTTTLDLSSNQTINFDLNEESTQLEEVIVEASAYEDTPEMNVTSTDLGKSTLDIQTIQEMPALFGEVDVIKAVQLLPGVQVQGEGSTNFFVRGGNADQNLIQLDEATVYNASHLMGFFSVFNPDAINYMQFYRGHLPAQYGGRLSSLLDIRMKDGNDQKFGVSGGIGVTSSRLTVEGPIKKEKASFMLSGRRTYVDQFFRLSKDESTRDTRIYFFDLNAKFNYKINDRNRIYASGYFGRDLNKIQVLQYLIDWGNSNGSLRWNHIFNEKLFSNTTVIYSKYDFLIDLSDEDTPFYWSSKVEDITFKNDFNFFPNPKTTLAAGFIGTIHQFEPGMSRDEPQNDVPTSKSFEGAIYYSADQQVTSKLSLNYGLRYSFFNLFGSTTLFNYGNNFEIISEEQTSGVYKTYSGLEPRFSARYLVGKSASIKASYNKNRQYMQLLSNLSLGMNVFDVWYPASKNIKPQIADQLSLGYFQNLADNAVEISLEGYYKKLKNQVDYVDHSTLIMNRELESELRTGTGRAYGVEFMLKKNGRLNGWVSYSYARALREIEGINNGEEYPALYDQPHNISVVTNYRLSDRWSVSTNWVFSSGRPVTLPTENFRYDKYIVPIYGPKNAERIPDYHRLDIGFTLLPKPKPNRKNHSSWNFSIYNAYNRANAASVFVSSELKDIDLVKDQDKSAFHKLSLFTIIPSVTYNFKF